MDVAFHFHPVENASYLASGRSERRLLGLLRLHADFSQGPIQAYGGRFCTWMLERYLSPDGSRLSDPAKFQQIQHSLRRRWQQESVSGWHRLGNTPLGETSPATDFMMIRNLSPRAAESINDGMNKRPYLQCAFEVSRRSDTQKIIYYGIAVHLYSFFSNCSAAYIVPYGVDEDTFVAWQLRRIGFTKTVRRYEMPSMEDLFGVVMRLIDEESNAKD